ncbi:MULTISPECIES: hypothetical protein [unclassified Halomonas]|uniref:hypothetical protein n=1 Tax=unclassified Halomonas TaxID=2609666 RepID=UPI0021BC11DC|nr:MULTISPECIES: hypothetical protein [unclassified Halomonas]
MLADKVCKDLRHRPTQTGAASTVQLRIRDRLPAGCHDHHLVTASVRNDLRKGEETDMSGLKGGLLAMRVGIFLVLLVWTLSKFINPAQGSGIIDKYFGVAGVDTAVVMVLGALELALILAFVAGLYKRMTYAGVLAIHGISTLVTIPAMVTDPFGHMLFFAALPMLAACYTLYRLRDEDTLLTLSRPASTSAA